MGKLGGLKRLSRLGRCNFFTRRATSFISFQLLNHSIELSVPFMPIWSSLWSSFPRRWWASLGTWAEAERLIPGRNQSPGTVENRLTSNSVRSSLVTESMNLVFHFVLAFLCYYVCCFNPVQLTLSLSPSSTNNPQHFTYVSPAPHPSHRVDAPQSFECRSIPNLRRPNRGGAEHDIMRKK